MANTVFGQEWILHNDDDSDSEDNDDESEAAAEEPKIKRSHSSKDLTYTMSTRQCISCWMEDAFYLNLEFVAKHLVHKDHSVVTVGLDDTTKAAGNK